MSRGGCVGVALRRLFPRSDPKVERKAIQSHPQSDHEGAVMSGTRMKNVWAAMECNCKSARGRLKPLRLSLLLSSMHASQGRLVRTSFVRFPSPFSHTRRCLQAPTDAPDQRRPAADPCTNIASVWRGGHSRPPKASDPSSGRKHNQQQATTAHLKTLPSAHSYFLPSTSIGWSQAHMSSTKVRSALFAGSSLVKA